MTSDSEPSISNNQQLSKSALSLNAGGLLFLFLLSLFLFARPLILLGDGGTARHFLTGLYLVEKHSLPVNNYISALEPNAPWVTHELLCDMLFGLPFPALGIGWVVLSSSIAIALSFAWSYQIGRKRGAGILSGLLILLFAIEACTIHWSARPHLFSYLLFLATFYECFVVERALKQKCIWLFAIILLWANLHGSFFLGLMMIGMRAIGDLLQSFRTAPAGTDASAKEIQSEISTETQESSSKADPDASSKLQIEEAQKQQAWTLRYSAIVIFCALIASCLNIRGAAFVSYVISYLLNPKIQFHSDEWRSIDFAFGLPVWSFLVLCFILFACWVYGKEKPRLGEFLFMSALACASIYAMRLVPYFALAALPAVAAQIPTVRSHLARLHWKFLDTMLAFEDRAGNSELKTSRSALPFLIATAIISVQFLFLPALKINDFDPARMPVAASDYMLKNKITGLGYCKDNWGSYMYWKLKEPIFVDDKTDFYSQKLLDDYTAILFTKPGWQQVLDGYNFKYVLIPPGLPLQFSLNEMKGWKNVFQDQSAVLFIRAPEKSADSSLENAAGQTKP